MTVIVPIALSRGFEEHTIKLERIEVLLGANGAVYRYDIASDHWTDWTGSPDFQSAVLTLPIEVILLFPGTEL